jgi:hypothetical protein
VFLLPEDVVGADGVLLAGDAGVGGSAAGGDQYMFGLDYFWDSVSTGELDFVGGEQLGVFVEVLDLFRREFFAVAEVEGLDVVTDLFREFAPVVFGFGVDIPPCLFQVFLGLAQQTSVVEQLFGDAAHVDAGTA